MLAAASCDVELLNTVGMLGTGAMFIGLYGKCEVQPLNKKTNINLSNPIESSTSDYHRSKVILILVGHSSQSHEPLERTR